MGKKAALSRARWFLFCIGPGHMCLSVVCEKHHQIKLAEKKKTDKDSRLSFLDSKFLLPFIVIVTLYYYEKFFIVQLLSKFRWFVYFYDFIAVGCIIYML